MSTENRFSSVGDSDSICQRTEIYVIFRRFHAVRTNLSISLSLDFRKVDSSRTVTSYEIINGL